MKTLFSLFLLVISCCFGSPSKALGATPDEFWKIETPQTLPFEEQLISESNDEGLVYKEFYFTSQVVDGQKYRIYAVYAAPKTTKKVPAILLIHGADGTADPTDAREWAKRGYACLSFDWWGNPRDRQLSRAQFSRFGADTELEVSKFEFVSPPQKSRAYAALIAARRAISWLQLQREVDAGKIGAIGVSWGGFYSLILRGIDKRIKAVVTVYGAGFFQETGINNGAFALTGPLIYLPVEQRKEWLDAFDPQHYVGLTKTPEFMMTGTNDIFFWLPLVQRTYTALPGEKRLWLEPNINHSIHYDQKARMNAAALRWFDSQLRGRGTRLPSVSEVTVSGNKVTFDVSPPNASITQATLNVLWLKQRPTGRGLSGTYNDKEAHWETIKAEYDKSTRLWGASLLTPATEIQGFAVFASVTTADNVTLSSPVTEADSDGRISPSAKE